MEPRYIQDTFRNDFQPYFCYASQVSLGVMHSDNPYSDITPQYHYHDCKCVECYKNHYPCNNIAECDYCYMVQSLMYDYVGSRNGAFTATGKQVKAEYGHIIDYVTYQELGDVELDAEDLLWKRCQCGILVCGYTYDMLDGYCSEECRDNDARIYCRTCLGAEVDYEGDRCRDCIVYCCGGDGYCETEVEEEGDICDYCAEHCDSGKYSAGDVVEPSDYPYLMNCWIDTKGRVRYVKYCNHEDTAKCMGYSGGTWDAERAGNIHFSEYWDSYNRWRFIPERPTQAQFDTMVALCLANTDNLKMPSILVKYMEQQKNKSSVAYVGNLTTRAYYTLPLATRRALHQGD